MILTGSQGKLNLICVESIPSLQQERQVMISIAICTYKRLDQLRPLLEQISSYGTWLEQYATVLVVDNAASKEVEQLVEQLNEQLPIEYLSEPKQGLANARNKALSAFDGDAILFVDDDTNLPRSTVESYVDALAQHPDVDYFGGKIRVDWQGQRPEWLKSDDLVLLNGMFGEYSLGDQDITYRLDTLGPFGANFMLTRRLVQSVGNFNSKLGVSGDALDRGEETDYFARALKQGASGLYLADAVVGHRFQVERLSTVHFYRYGLAKGRFQAKQRDLRSQPWLGPMLKQLCLGVGQLLKSRRDRFYQCIINAGIHVGAARYYKQGGQ